MRIRPRLFGILVLVVGLAAAAAACGQAQAPAASRPLTILITNDDGIEAPGIMALAEAFGPLGRVTVAAPRHQRSGASHGVTSDRPIQVRESERGGQRWIAIDALPATCVRLAVEELLPVKPDLVLSGINRGENLGTVTFYSATVAAAREAAFQGLPAIAVNLAAGEDMDYGAAAAIAVAIVKAIGPEGIPRGAYLNINVPALPRERLLGIRLTRQDTRAPIDRFERSVSPEGLVEYTPSWSHLEPAGDGTDIWAVRKGYVSVSVFGFDQSAAAPPGVFTSLRRLESLPLK
jgi:5'-nucleotidase